MKVISGDLWEIGAFIVVPTNLTIRSDGAAVMGRGVAKQASLFYPSLPQEYGLFLSQAPQSSLFVHHGYRVICLPVKKRWQDKADLNLIRQGVQQLANLPLKIAPIALPMLGCGFGELSAKDVTPILNRYLQNNRFTLVLRDEEATRKHAATLKPGARVDRAALRDIEKFSKNKGGKL